jgi:SPP1 family predicted phage head-tail adaptor
MRSGTLRHVIDIQDAAETPDGMGGFTTSYSDIYSGLRASIWPLSASEHISNDKIELSITHRIRVRYRSGIKADMKVVFGSREFNIKSIINSEMRNIMLEMLCEEIDGGS